MRSTFFPYRDVFWKGMFIYCQGLRPYVAGRLQKTHGVDAPDRIRETLRGDHRRMFADKLAELNGDWSGALDIVHLSSLVQVLWGSLFSQEFGNGVPVRSHVAKLAEARNVYAHDLTGDMNRVYVKYCLRLMAQVMLAIKRRDLQSQIHEVAEVMGGSRQLPGQELLSTRCDPVKLNLLMEKWYWDNGIGQYHLKIVDLWKDMAKGKRRQLSGALNKQDLLDCLARGIDDRVFGRAEDYDAEEGAYVGLTMGLDSPMAVYSSQLVQDDALIVNADRAELHLDGRESLFVRQGRDNWDSTWLAEEQG